MNFKRTFLLVGCTLFVGTLQASGYPQSVECAALPGYSYSRLLPRDTLISSAVLNAPTATVPEHCQVQGTIEATVAARLMAT